MLVGIWAVRHVKFPVGVARERLAVDRAVGDAARQRRDVRAQHLRTGRRRLRAGDAAAGTRPDEAKADVVDVFAGVDAFEVVGAAAERGGLPAERIRHRCPVGVQPDAHIVPRTGPLKGQRAALAAVRVAVAEVEDERTEGAVLEDDGRSREAEGRPGP